MREEVGRFYENYIWQYSLKLSWIEDHVQDQNEHKRMNLSVLR